MKKIAIFGSSSFGREVADICHDLGFEDKVFIDDFTDATEVDGIRVFKTHDVKSLETEGYQFTIGVGSSEIRRKIVADFPDLPYPNIIHPAATFGRRQREAIDRSKGNIIAAGVRLTNNIEVGNFVVLNLNVVIGHDCILEDYVSIMSGSLISGNVAIREGVYIGCGVSIIDGSAQKKVEIGKNSLIGMGAVVIRRVKENSKVFGNPARPQG